MDKLQKNSFWFDRKDDGFTIQEEDEYEEQENSNINYSTMALIEKLSTEVDLKDKLEKVIHILSSIKKDFWSLELILFI